MMKNDKYMRKSSFNSYQSEKKRNVLNERLKMFQVGMSLRQWKGFNDL